MIERGLENYIKLLYPIAKDLNIPLYDLHRRFQEKTTQYLYRDTLNNKSVDYMNPVKQYNRAIKVIYEYYRRHK